MENAKRTPPTNRGVIKTMEHAELESLIDWCQVTVKQLSPEMIANDLLKIPFNLLRNDERGGIPGYRAMMCFDDIRILEGVANTENGYQILMSGKGCRNFEKFLEAHKETWYDFLQRVNDYDVNFTRIDLAIDDRKTYFTIPSLIEKARTGLLVSKLKIASEQGSFRLTDGSTRGQTLNLGSRESQFFITLYEKNYEQASKLGGLEEQVAEDWNRYELKFRQERANALVKELIKRREVFTVAMEVLNECVRFVEKPKDSEDDKASRYPLWEPWAEFMQDVGKLNLCMKPEAKNYLTMLAWIEKTVAPTLKILKIIDDIMETNVLGELIENAKFTEKHEQLLEACLYQVAAFETYGMKIA